jgi:hypothetical protein
MMNVGRPQRARAVARVPRNLGNEVDARQSTLHMQQVDQWHLGSLQRHWKRHDTFPSMAKLADVMGLASSGSVFQAVGRLVEKVFLERVDGRIAPTSRFFARPVLGQGEGRAARPNSGLRRA